MKKFLSILLAVMMVVTILPVNLMAVPLELEEHSHEHAAEAAEPQADAEPLAEGTIITINQIDYTIEGKKDVVISGTVKTEGGTPITSGTLEVLIDGRAVQKQPALQSDGSFSASVSGVRSGSHKATVKYSGGGAYGDAEAEADFYVNPKEFFIRVDSNGYSMDDNVFKGTIRMSYPEDDGSSTVYYGTGFGIMVPSYRGINLLAIPSAGYKLEGWYRDNENGDLLTDKEEWIIGSNDIYAAYTHYAKFVKDDSKTTYAVTFVDGLERMSINGFTITKTSGTVLPDDLSAPNYTVEPGWSVSFSIEASSGYIKTADYKVLCNGVELTAVDGVYTISNINENKEIRVNGIVDKTAPVVTINDIPAVMYGEKVVVSGTVIDVDGKPVTEGTVQVYVDDVASWAAVALAADGSFICEIPGIEAGEHIATAKYFAEKTYVDASANKNFTVLAGHTHCICGGKSENHASHSAVTYTAWDGGEITYTNGAAYLYIPADTTVTLKNDITIGRNQTLYLCLNEKSSILASNGSAHIIINGAGARLVICSCRSEQGTFKGRTDGAGSGGCIELNYGTLDIYGGNIGYANAEKGGAIYAYGDTNNTPSTVNIYGGSICGSTAVNGGGLYMAHRGEDISLAKVYIYGGTIENNKATENGGGVYIEGALPTSVGLWLNGGAIRKNNAAGNGGGIYSYLGRNVVVTGGEISENTATNGGGMYLTRDKTNRMHGLLEMSGGKITGNTATENGGGIYATHVMFGSTDTGSVGFRNVEISGNNAKNGGGIYAETGCSGNIRDSVIENNKAARTGGGIYITDNFWSTLFIRGTTRVINNNAYTAGGIAVIDAGKVEINDSALIKDNTTININDVSQILVDGNDGKNASTVIMNGGTIDSYEVESDYGIQLKNGAAFTVNGGYMDIFGAAAGIDNADGTFTVNGGVVESCTSAWTNGRLAYSTKPTVKDTMFAREGRTKGTAQDVALSNVDWESRYIYLGTGYSVDIDYYNLEGATLPEDAPKKHVYGTTTVLPIPTRDGYNFDGWYEDTSFTKGPVTEIGADVTGSSSTRFTFYAKWTKISEWNEPTYVWTEIAGGYQCTATRTHKTDASKAETETVTATYNVVSAATCDYDGYGVYLATFTNEAFKAQTKTVTLPKGHAWETPRYNWTPDILGGYKCTATRTCYRNMSHVETETVVATLIEGTSATCTEDGHGKYNAVFTNPAFREQTKEFDTPATGHAWNEPTYNWEQTANGYNCTAKRICANYASHVETETVAAAYAEITPATEEAEGLGRYTATFKNEAFAEQTKDVTLPKIVHDWDYVTIWWEGEYCIASRTCKAHGETESEKVKGVYSVEIEPGCTTAGRGKYVAYFTNPVFTAVTSIYGSPTKTIPLPALGHDWDTASFSWREEEGDYICDAVHYCKRNEAHFEASSTHATYEVITQPTCEADGLGRYTAVFTLVDFETQTKDVVIPKNGHDWDVTTYEWSEAGDGYTVTAKHICKTDASHVETENVTAVYAVVTPATCLKDGLGRFTAEFKADWAETQTKDLTLKAFGHDWSEVTYTWTEENGVYKVRAYRECQNAGCDYIGVDQVTAEYAVVTPATCTEDGVGRYTAEFHYDWAGIQTKDVVLKATGHDWDTATYEWTKDGDGYTATAKRVCKTDASHVETETVTATYAVITAETCENSGLGRYTAEFKAAWAETQTKDLTLKATGHNWSETAYTWTEDGDVYKVRAYRECQNAGCDYVGVDQVTAEYAVVTPATCTEDGLGRYTAEFHYDWAGTQTKDVVLKATGHDWDATTYEWTKAGDGYTVTAKHICKTDANHVETETVTATYAVITAETCLADGLGRYTAKFKADWAETQTKDLTLKALGHDWGEPTYRWNKNNDSYMVNAESICNREGCTYIRISVALAEYKVITPATCTEDGLGRYTAVFEDDWAETQTKDVVLSATGHDWAATTYEWTKVSDGYTVTAKRVCNNDASHVETETVTATYVITIEETCENNGRGRYTAEFKASWAETQTKDEARAALDHDWSETEYTWIERGSGYTVRAYRECKREGCSNTGFSHAEATYAVVTPATCLEDGLGRYSVSFIFEWAKPQTKDVVLKAIGHDWAATTYEWTKTNDGYTVTAKRVCKNDASHVETEAVTASYAIITAENCVKEGLGRYTAEFKADWAETQTKDEVRPAMGHDWAATTYEWTEVKDGYTVTAKRVCKNDEKHVETENVTATYAVITEQTCVAEGLGRYTAEFKADWAKTQTKDVAIPANGHDHSSYWRYNEFEHWRICPVCKDIIDVQAHDLTDWKTILDNRGKDTDREERHCRICAYEQFSTTIHITDGKNGKTEETNPNTGAEVFIPMARAAAAENRVNALY